MDNELHALTEQQQRAKDNLLEFAKNHPIVKQQARVEGLEKALRELLIAKKYKDDYGKDENYERMKNKAWGLAREALRKD